MSACSSNPDPPNDERCVEAMADELRLDAVGVASHDRSGISAGTHVHGTRGDWRTADFMDGTGIYSVDASISS